MFENTWVYSTSCACAFVPVHGFWTAKPAVDSPIPESARHGWPPASVYTYATRPSTKLNLNHRARQTVDHWRASADAKNEKKQALAQQSQPGQAASAPFDGDPRERYPQHRPAAPHYVPGGQRCPAGWWRPSRCAREVTDGAGGTASRRLTRPPHHGFRHGALLCGWLGAVPHRSPFRTRSKHGPAH